MFLFQDKWNHVNIIIMEIKALSELEKRISGRLWQT